MFALQARHCLYIQIGRTPCVCAFVLGRQLSNDVENNTSIDSKKEMSKVNALRRNVENKQLFGPVVSEQSKKTREKTNKKLSSAETDETYASDLSEAEMKKLNAVIYKSIFTKILCSKGKFTYEKDLIRVCKLPTSPKGSPAKATSDSEVTKSDRPKRKVNRTSRSIEKAKSGLPEFSFPLCNPSRHKTKEEAIIHLKSTIPQDWHIGKDVSCAHILESTSSDSDLSGNQKTPLSNEAKVTLENQLSPHFTKYLDENKCLSSIPDPDLPPDLMGYWKSMLPVFRDLSQIEGFDVKTTHPVLGYTASADVICSYKGLLVTLDWKTHIGLTNPSLPVGDYTLQTMACIGALNFDVNFSFQRPLHAVSVITYASGKPAHLLPMKSVLAKLYWTNWLQRLSLFHRRNCVVN